MTYLSRVFKTLKIAIWEKLTIAVKVAVIQIGVLVVLAFLYILLDLIVMRFIVR